MPENCFSNSLVNVASDISFTLGALGEKFNLVPNCFKRMSIVYDTSGNYVAKVDLSRKPKTRYKTAVSGTVGMGELTHIQERSKRRRFEAPVQAQEFSIHRPCAIFLEILHHT